MPIDISKIKPGDRVRCEFEVHSILAPGEISGVVTKVENYKFAVPLSSITEHIPQPYVPKVGDRVRVGPEGRSIHLVRGVYGSEAWVHEEGQDTPMNWVLRIEKLVPVG